jgi:teichuronic acid biosynthesis glycosyltransferase TuaG
LSQTHTEIEVLVIDDASTDGTADLVKQIVSNDNRVRILSLCVNKGPGAARNRGIEAAQGRFVAFLDADDIWEPDKLALQLEFMRANRLGFSYTPYALIAENGAWLGKYVDIHAQDRVTYSDMLRKRSTLGCSTVLLDRNITGPLRLPDFRSGQDYCLWLSILKTGVDAFCLREPLTRYRIVSGSVSRNKLKKARRQWEIYRKHENLPLVPSTWYFCNYAWRALLR